MKVQLPCSTRVAGHSLLRQQGIEALNPVCYNGEDGWRQLLTVLCYPKSADILQADMKSRCPI